MSCVSNGLNLLPWLLFILLNTYSSQQSFLLG